MQHASRILGGGAKFENDGLIFINSKTWKTIAVLKCKKKKKKCMCIYVCRYVCYIYEV